jgi:hypothetical protein
MAWTKEMCWRPMLGGIAALLISAGCGDDKNGQGTVDGGDSSVEGDGDSTETPSDNPADPNPTDQQAPTKDLDAGQEPIPSDGSVPPSNGDAGALVSLPADGNRLAVCYEAADCNGDDLTCYIPDSIGPGFCTEDCAADKDCQALEGMAMTCSPEGQCRVDCTGKGSGDGKCPTHMACRDVAVGLLAAPSYRCTYPEGSGSRASAKYEQCDPMHDDGDCKDKLACFVPSVFGTGTGPGYCAPACTAVKDCTAPGGTSAAPVCESGHCSFNCKGAGTTCPAGMNCRDIDESPIGETFRCRFIN